MTHVTHKQEDLKVASSCRIELGGAGGGEAEMASKSARQHKCATQINAAGQQRAGGVSCCLALAC